MSLRAAGKCRILWLCASGHRSSSDMLLKVSQIPRHERFFATTCVNREVNDDTMSDYSKPNIKPTLRRALLSRRRSLSPLERVSSLLPQDSLTPEVEELRGSDQYHVENGTSRRFDYTPTHSIDKENGYPCEMEKCGQIPDHAISEETKNTKQESLRNGALYQARLKGETLLTFGEVLVAEYRKKGHVEFRKMFQLLARTRLQSSWGVILHEDIAGNPAGSFIKTNRGVSILIRRASLEDYVLFMKRGPAITYPKEAAAMLMMMDVTEGDCVLEAGSGSGAMSLFLSRAVGVSGRVMSVEVREDHLKRAVLNYNRWRTSWDLRRGQPWPDNVEFVQADLCTATPVLQGREFHAMCLDLIHPQLVLSTVIPHLHSGAVCTIYLANITQVIDLLEGLRCLHLPLLCERIMELPCRDWLVAPAVQKDGSYCIRKVPITQDNCDKNDESLEKVQIEHEATFGSIPYIARPHPEQLSHAGMYKSKTFTDISLKSLIHISFCIHSILG